jgi:dGTPase
MGVSNYDFDPTGTRSIFQQDYDRLLFSTPVRRLADKTQVWPMDDNDGVRTRLTHSHEVANLARSIGTKAYSKKKASFGAGDLHAAIQPMLAASGIAHDLGNPPFGHQGEAAMGAWFTARQGWIFTKLGPDKKAPRLDNPVPRRLWPEFTSFDGNPQSLRLLTRLQTHHAGLGLDLSAGTLAATLKYPVSVSGVCSKDAQSKKAGYFESERDIVTWIRSETGLDEAQRHPLTWIMEACDDIAYSVLDVDDLLKKRVLSPDDVLVLLLQNTDTAEHKATQKIKEKFLEVQQSGRRAEIKQDIKIQYLRAYLIDALIDDASNSFVGDIEPIMELRHSVALMEGNKLCDALKLVAAQYGFRHPSVLRAEAIGGAAIDGIMSTLWDAISE